MDGDDGSRRPVPALGPFLGACALAALWIDFGSIHQRHQGDSLLNVLISLYRWTPFLWEQDRFGMLVPLLARPIRHPLANLLFQEFFAIFSGLAVFFLLARHTMRDARYPVAATLGAAGFIAFASPYYRFEYLIDTSFGLGLALALGGLILVEPRDSGIGWGRWASATALMVLAHWVSFGTAVFLGPLVVFRALPGGELNLRSGLAALARLRSGSGSVGDRLRAVARQAWEWELVRDLLLLGLGYEAGLAIMGLSPYHQTALHGLRPEQWPEAWERLALRTWDDLAPPRWPALLAVELALGLLLPIVPGTRRNASGAWRVAGALMAAALVVMLLTGTRRWVVMNNYPSRYLIPSVLYLQGAGSVLAVAFLDGAFGSKTVRRLACLTGPVLLLASALAYGLPSLAHVRADLDRTLGARTADVIDGRCTHVAGNYWTVWPTVFHANLVLFERGEDRVVWGVTFRAHPTYTLWKSMPRESVRVAIPNGDGFGMGWLQAYPMLFHHVVEVERRPTIRILGAETIVPSKG